MERMQRNLRERRALTDASLGAERASTEANTLSTTQRAFDDSVERDRIFADQRLRELRRHTDSVIAHERSARLVDDSAVLDHKEPVAAFDAANRSCRLAQFRFIQSRRARRLGEPFVRPVEDNYGHCAVTCAS